MNLPIRIVAPTGKPKAGKGTAAAFLKDRYGAQIIHFSGILAGILKSGGSDPIVPTLADLWERISKKLGQEWITGFVGTHVEMHQASASPPPLYVLETIRLPADALACRELWGPHFLLIDINAPL